VLLRANSVYSASYLHQVIHFDANINVYKAYSIDSDGSYFPERSKNFLFLKVTGWATGDMYRAVWLVDK